jgi:CheY-like chemotaxis protein
MSLDSVVGKGSTFTVSVPYKIDTSAPKPVAEAAVAVDMTALRGKEILLAEDNEINRQIVHEMLKLNGLIVHEAHNGQEVIDLAARREYAAILMDISMPVMNGVDATEIIRSTSGPNQNAKIIGLTAHALADEQARFIACGMDTILNKPISQATLLAALLAAVQGDDHDQLLDALSPKEDLVAGETFEELKQLLQAERLQKLLLDFDVEIETLLGKLPQLLLDGDMQVLAANAHKSVGSSGMIGARQFQANLRHLEQAAKSGDADGVQTASEIVTSSWPATQAALKAKSSTLG